MQDGEQRDSVRQVLDAAEPPARRAYESLPPPVEEPPLQWAKPPGGAFKQKPLTPESPLAQVQIASQEDSPRPDLDARLALVQKQLEKPENDWSKLCATFAREVQSASLEPDKKLQLLNDLARTLLDQFTLAEGLKNAEGRPGAFELSRKIFAMALRTMNEVMIPAIEALPGAATQYAADPFSPPRYTADLRLHSGGR